jgi:hypothetical protein
VARAFFEPGIAGVAAPGSINNALGCGVVATSLTAPVQISDRMYVEVLRRLSAVRKNLTKIGFAAYGNISVFRVHAVVRKK